MKFSIEIRTDGGKGLSIEDVTLDTLDSVILDIKTALNGNRTI